MQLSLFDTINYYKDIIIDNADITHKPSKSKHPYLIDSADVFYHKGTPLFQLELEKSTEDNRWHFRVWSITGKSCSSYAVDDVCHQLNKIINMRVEVTK